jgi:hypothetical protein
MDPYQWWLEPIRGVVPLFTAITTTITVVMMTTMMKCHGQVFGNTTKQKIPKFKSHSGYQLF